MPTDHHALAERCRQIAGITAPPPPVTVTLPRSHGERRYVLTDADLYDLAYHAVTRQLADTVTKANAHRTAARVAELVIATAAASDFTVPA